MSNANQIACNRLSKTLAFVDLPASGKNQSLIPMQLEMKTRCEKCGVALHPDGEAYICSYECTFCSACSSDAQGICPNCAGELIRRPKRSAALADSKPRDPEPPQHNRPWLIWVVSFAVWTFLALVATGTIYEMYRTAGRANFKETLFLQFGQILPYAPLTPFVFALAMRYPLQRKNWVRRSLLHLGFALVFSVLHVMMRALTPYAVWDPQSRHWVSALWDARTHALTWQWPKLQMLFYANVLDDITGAYVPIVLISQAIGYYQRLREREFRTSQLEIQLAKSHLQVLKSQLQPHFLFNTLHSISALMHTDVRAADKMMTRLSDLLRMTLENNAAQLTTLSRELEFVNGYLEIEKVRLEDRLSVVLDIAPDTLDAQVPSLLLQPLVENAVKHGISRQSEGGEIRIGASHDDRNLYLKISDNGPGFGDAGGSEPTGGSESSTGLGLRATRDRIKTLYGGEQSLDIRELPHRGVEVCVRIPFRPDPRLLMYGQIPEGLEEPAGESSSGA
jgi:signal transduction histidine kinase